MKSPIPRYMKKAQTTVLAPLKSYKIFTAESTVGCGAAFTDNKSSVKVYSHIGSVSAVKSVKQEIHGEFCHFILWDMY